MQSRASGPLQFSWGTCSSTSKALSTTEDDELFNKATASLRVTPVSSTPFTFNKMSPDGQRSKAILRECEQELLLEVQRGRDQLGRGDAERAKCTLLAPGTDTRLTPHTAGGEQ